jgi:hypothetical protein
MNKSLLFVPLLLIAAPAVGQPAPPQLPPELTDPATTQKLTNAMQALSRAFLDVRVGEVRAALEGRPATPSERRMTVRDMARRDDPDFDRHMQQQIANVGPMMQRSMNALNQALPAVIQSLTEAQKSIERAVANIPDPTYPRR